MNRTLSPARRLPIVTLVAVSASALLGCGENPVEQTREPQLELSADSVAVDVGAAAAVSATVRNAVEPAQFASRDQAVATVSAGGQISGVAPGSTYVVATLVGRADVRDSVRVLVTLRTGAADSCAVVRPDFGEAATAADRAQFAYDVAAPLDLQKTVVNTTGGVQVSTIAFDSPDGGSVTGFLVDPINRSGPRPGIVLMHGGPGNAAQMMGQGVALAQHGAVVIAIDAPHARRPGQWVQFLPADRVEQVQLIKDLQRAVDVLRARPNVDAARIAYVGVSYGGAMGALFVGVERRLKAAVLEVADGGLVTHFTDALGYMVTDLSCAARVAWFRTMAPIEPIRFIPLASPTPLLLQNGRFDTAVSTTDAEALHAAAPEPKTVRWYDAGHALGTQSLVDRHQWLNAQIGLDLFTP